MKFDITLNIKGVDFDVIGHITPEQKETRWDQGWPAEIDEISVFHKETDFSEFFFDELNMQKEIEQMVWYYFTE